MKQKNLVAICFDENKKAHKYKYKLVENSRSLISFENFCRNKKYSYINYYDKDTTAFVKQKKL
jgi:hypothetical protein